MPISVLILILECEEEEFKMENSEIIVEGRCLISLRTYLVSYLNLLEVIFTTWQSNVGDRKMIEEEFAKNITPDGKEFPIEQITEASHFFPSIKQYTFELKEKNRRNPKKRRKIE